MTNLRQHAGRIHRLGLPVLIVAALAVLALAFLGCSSSTTTTAAPPSSAGAATTGAAGTGGAQVIMQNIAFSPQTVTIKAGDTVTWTNQDSVDHNITAADGSFKSSTLANGGTFSHTFAQAGTYAYSCTIHPGMTGTVIVQ